MNVCKHGLNPTWCGWCGDERRRGGPSAFDGALGQPQDGARQMRAQQSELGEKMRQAFGTNLYTAPEPAPFALTEQHLAALENAIRAEGYRILVEVGTGEVVLHGCMVEVGTYPWHELPVDISTNAPAYEESDWCTGCGVRPGNMHTPKYPSSRGTCEEYGYPGLFRGLDADYGGQDEAQEGGNLRAMRKALKTVLAAARSVTGLQCLVSPCEGKASMSWADVAGLCQRALGADNPVGPSYEQLEIGLRNALHVAQMAQLGVPGSVWLQNIEAIAKGALGE